MMLVMSRRRRRPREARPRPRTGQERPGEARKGLKQAQKVESMAGAVPESTGHIRGSILTPSSLPLFLCCATYFKVWLICVWAALLPCGGVGVLLHWCGCSDFASLPAKSCVCCRMVLHGVLAVSCCLLANLRMFLGLACHALIAIPSLKKAGCDCLPQQKISSL